MHYSTINLDRRLRSGPALCDVVDVMRASEAGIHYIFMITVLLINETGAHDHSSQCVQDLTPDRIWYAVTIYPPSRSKQIEVVYYLREFFNSDQLLSFI